jgi:hypothetical protein
MCPDQGHQGPNHARANHIPAVNATTANERTFAPTDSAPATKSSGGPSAPFGADEPGLGAPPGPFPPPFTSVGAVGKGDVGVVLVVVALAPPVVCAGGFVRVTTTVVSIVDPSLTEVRTVVKICTLGMLCVVLLVDVPP